MKHLFRFWNYHIYFTDFIITPLFFIFKKKQLKIGLKNKFLGKPIITFNNSSGFISIGNNGLYCSRSKQTALGLSHPVILRTLRENAKIIIGNNVRMSGTTICAASMVEVGNNCVIGADVMIADTDFHSLNPEIRNSSMDSLNARYKPVKIGHNVFIGGRSIILKGVELGSGVVVGAGSIVRSSFPANSIIAGNPAKLIR